MDRIIFYVNFNWFQNFIQQKLHYSYENFWYKAFCKISLNPSRKLIASIPADSKHRFYIHLCRYVMFQTAKKNNITITKRKKTLDKKWHLHRCMWIYHYTYQIETYIHPCAGLSIYTVVFLKRNHSSRDNIPIYHQTKVQREEKKQGFELKKEFKKNRKKLIVFQYNFIAFPIVIRKQYENNCCM